MLQNINSRPRMIQFSGWVGPVSRQKRRPALTSLSPVFSNCYNMISCVRIVEPNFIQILFTWSNLPPIKLSGLPSSWDRLLFVFDEQSFLDLSRLSVAGGLNVSRDDTSACAYDTYRVQYSTIRKPISDLKSLRKTSIVSDLALWGPFNHANPRFQ